MYKLRFVKVMGKSREEFIYIKSYFPNASDAKLKEEIFIGPQIRKVLKDENFKENLSTLEMGFCKAFASVVHTFMSNTKF